MKNIFWFMLTLTLYIVSIMSFVESMRNNDTYLIGLAIVGLMFASKTEKKIGEVKE